MIDVPFSDEWRELGRSNGISVEKAHLQDYLLHMTDNVKEGTMSATYGTFRLIYEDASWFLGKRFCCTLRAINRPGLLSGHPLIWIRHSVLFQAPRIFLYPVLWDHGVQKPSTYCCQPWRHTNSNAEKLLCHRRFKCICVYASLKPLTMYIMDIIRSRSQLGIHYACGDVSFQ